MKRIDLFKRALSEKRAVKVISGINNFDMEKVEMVVKAATEAGASAVDICADETIVSKVRTLTDLPIFVSSIEPEKLAKAVELGADAIELGNFDALYESADFSMTSEEVLNLVQRTLELVDSKGVFFSVTIPGNLSISEQIKLGKRLETMGIDLIQTEGFVKSESDVQDVKGMLNRAELTLANTIELSRNIELPIMTASNINTTTASFAFAAGASAIGCGSCVNKLESSISMLAVVSSLVEIANRNTSKTLTLV